MVETKKVTAAVVVTEKVLSLVAAAAEEAERRYHVQVQVPEVGERFNSVAVKGFLWDVRRAMAFLRPTRPEPTTWGKK